MTGLNSDLYAQVYMAQNEDEAALSRGDVEGVRRRASWILSTWLPDQYTVQTFYSTWARCMCDLFEGRPDDAIARLEEDEPRFLGSGGAWVTPSRLDRAFVVLRASLLRGDRRRAEEAIASLQREARPDAPLLAEALRMGLDREASADRLAGRYEELAEAFEALSMAHYAAGCRARAAVVRGDEPAKAAADARLVALGVRDPSRWLGVMLPVVGA